MLIKLRIGYEDFVTEMSGAELEAFHAAMRRARLVKTEYNATIATYELKTKNEAFRVDIEVIDPSTVIQTEPQE